MECCTFTYRVYMVFSVENEAIGYGDLLRYNLKKNGCMLLDDIWCIFIAKCSQCHLVSLFCKNNI